MCTRSSYCIYEQILYCLGSIIKYTGNRVSNLRLSSKLLLQYSILLLIETSRYNLARWKTTVRAYSSLEEMTILPSSG